jgi:molybdate transport system regulatory protein
VIKVKAKIWLEIDSNCIIGQGRAELLRKIKELGSLSEVARSMGMAYSHAWSEIKEISNAIGGQVIVTSRGGKQGGGSRLTELGEELLNRFDEETNSLDGHLSKRNKP